MLLSFPYIVNIIVLLCAAIFVVQETFAIQRNTELSTSFTVIVYCMKKSLKEFCVDVKRIFKQYYHIVFANYKQ